MCVPDADGKAVHTVIDAFLPNIYRIHAGIIITGFNMQRTVFHFRADGRRGSIRIGAACRECWHRRKKRAYAQHKRQKYVSDFNFHKVPFPPLLQVFPGAVPSWTG